MFRHFLLMASRSFIRHKLYGVINIAGLSIGLACAILITLFVRDEISYDKWIPGSEHLYRLEVTFRPPGRSPVPRAQTPFPVARMMRENIPEVTAITRIAPWPMTVIIGDRQFPETVTLVDPNFLQVIRLPLRSGDPARVLARPQSVVLSESVARKYFGNADPVGKVVVVSSGLADAVHSLTVTAVLRDLPLNTQLVADVIVPNTSQADGFTLEQKERSWTSTDGNYGYVALAPGADPDAVLARLPPMLDRSIDLKRFGINMRGSELEHFRLTRLRDAHLTSDQFGGMRPPGNRATVYGFALIALLIVLVACFNFMNLATARATLRAKEIALRKVAGARRRQLIVQFLGEATLMALASLVVALVLVEVLLPAYGNFLNRPLSFDYLADWQLSLTVLGGAIVAGLLGGLYPAFVLSGFRPAAALKMSAAAQTGSGWIRMALVVFQFAVSIALGIAAIVVFTQISFARGMDQQFRRDGIVVVNGIRQLSASARESFARTVGSHPQVAGVALSNAVPFDSFPVSNDQVGKPGDSQGFTARIVCMKAEFPSLYDMPLLAGRQLSSKYGEDATGGNVLVNERAARRFGYSARTAVGKPISLHGGSANITGVLGDSKMDGVRELAPAAVFQECEDRISFLSVRLRAGPTADALAFIDKTWRFFAPNSAINRYFMSDAFDRQFRADETQGTMFCLFVGIAIFIACLGLFGLAVFTAARRTKEIGVRKVFGARPIHIVRLMLRQVSRPVLLANLIAWPVAYYYLRHWLDGYVDRISLNPLYFLIAGGVALLIACTTVFTHVLALARASPVHSLRHE